MKKKLTRKEAQTKIEELFARGRFSSDEVRKIKRIAMKFNIKLGENKNKFCKKCLLRLKGKTRVTKNYKIVKCASCGFLNRFKLNN